MIFLVTKQVAAGYIWQIEDADGTVRAFCGQAFNTMSMCEIDALQITSAIGAGDLRSRNVPPCCHRPAHEAATRGTAVPAVSPSTKTATGGTPVSQHPKG